MPELRQGVLKRPEAGHQFTATATFPGADDLFALAELCFTARAAPEPAHELLEWVDHLLEPVGPGPKRFIMDGMPNSPCVGAVPASKL